MLQIPPISPVEIDGNQAESDEVQGYYQRYAREEKDEFTQGFLRIG
nr:hypothetical protein [Pedobacter sp. SYSU D00382]